MVLLCEIGQRVGVRHTTGRIVTFLVCGGLKTFLQHILFVQFQPAMNKKLVFFYVYSNIYFILQIETIVIVEMLKKYTSC